MEDDHTSKSQNSKQPLASTCSRTRHYSPASREAGQISDLPPAPGRARTKGSGVVDSVEVPQRLMLELGAVLCDDADYFDDVVV